MAVDVAAIAAKAKQKALAQAGAAIAPAAPTPTVAAPVAAPAPAPAPAITGAADPMATLALALTPHIAAGLQGQINQALAKIDDAKIGALVDDAVRKYVAKPITVEVVTTTPQGKHTAPAKMVHRQYADLLDLLAAGLKPFLIGPAGSFKTSTFRMAAADLGYTDENTFVESVSQATTEGKLMGFTDAHGNPTITKFRRAYVDGGAFLMDEIDNGSANALAVLNGPIDATSAGFPDGMFPRHERFMFAAAGNTWGKGADRQYVGRNQLDAATLNRLVPFYWDYDEELEKAINGPDVVEWTVFCQRMRAAVAAAKVHHLVTPRQMFAGAALIRRGWAVSKVADTLLWAGLSADAKSAITAKM